jgi:uncharacterized protein YkwD
MMLRALVILFTMLTVSWAACAAAPAAAAIEVHNDSSEGSASSTARGNSAAGASSGSSAGSGEDLAAENELLDAANQSREHAGVPALRMNESLRLAALAHARRMVASERLEHQFSDEPPLMERIALVTSPSSGEKMDGLRLDRAGENVAYANSAPGANQALMRSPPHRENLLDAGFTVTGMAAIWSNGRLYVVQDFARETPTYSASESGKSIGRAVAELGRQAGLAELVQLTPAKLDEAACSLARENRPNARLLATAYEHRKIIAYTQSRPEMLPEAALPVLRDPEVRQFAVGVCFARNAAYPGGTYWVAILLY